jgi:hypothetical protein
MNENEIWDAWSRGESRCPHCINMGDDEFEAMCDCSRYTFEKTGKQLSIEVIGHPESITPVMPIQPERET